MKRFLQCAEQQVLRSNLTKHCACRAERLACLILVTYETSFTLRGATGVTIQPHQIPPATQNDDSRSNKCHPPPSPNMRLPRKMTFQNFRENLRKQVKRHLHWGDDPSMIREWSDHETVSPQLARIFCLKIQRFAPRLSFKNSPSAAPATKVTLERNQVVHLPRKVTIELRQILHLPRRKIHMLYETLFTLRGATGASIQPHQILRLSGRKTRMRNPHHL